ncbi:TIGR02611 family protein [Saccharopolyspora sp. NPDC047091]|uniref:TIGR02611 family protein n=1 Tax=Saccharopolyspora sp. NPDC047091 TaxID=3155924 RepID=UPI0033DA5795
MHGTATTEPAAEPTTEPAVGPATEPVAESTVGSASEPAVGSAAEPVVGSASEPVVLSAVGSATEPVVESAVGSATEPVTEPATGSTAATRPSLRDRYRARRDRARRSRAADLAWRAGIGIAGTAVLVAGIIMIPYPGPGWVVAFAGLAVLGTEFATARRALAFLRHRYDRWNEWQRGRHPAVRLLLLAATAAVVLGTVWLLGAFEFGARLLGVDLPFLMSPLG